MMMTDATAPETGGSQNKLQSSQFSWLLALAGQFVFVFAILALSGPGRIDIVDGQTRYEVARSLVEHGDSAIRDKEVWFTVYEGRDGARYSEYRFPQSGAGVVAIWVADATGAVSEVRRQFFFSLISPFCGAVLAFTYSVWFRRMGLGPRASLAWATAGIFCTPNWYYSTSTFDDMLGTTTVVLAVVIAWLGRDKRPLLSACAVGLLMAWAVNCKPPLALLALPAFAAFHLSQRPMRMRVVCMAIVAACIFAGVVAYKLYDMYKFPDGIVKHPELQAGFWTWNPLPGILSLALSPSCGILWYCPTILLSWYGWRRWRETQPLFALAVLIASGLLTLFICFLPFFKGEPTWGPRYLTPIFALAWLFVPAAPEVSRRRLVGVLLTCGALVQLLGLSMDPQRLFYETPLTFDYYYQYPWLGFNPESSHLVQRPREIVETILGKPYREEDNKDRPKDKQLRRAPAFSPAPLPTHAGGFTTASVVNIASFMGSLAIPRGTPRAFAAAMDRQAVFGARAKYVFEEAYRHYHIYNAFRPWWVAQWYLAEDIRPVDLSNTVVLLCMVGLAGLVLMLCVSKWQPEVSRSDISMVGRPFKAGASGQPPTSSGSDD
jgi:hypothetical protein